MNLQEIVDLTRMREKPMEEFGFIYIAKNKDNGKIYVGQTISTIHNRIQSHVRNNNGCIFGHALRKYGIQGFEVQCIKYKREELNKYEKIYIELLNSMHPSGYNLTHGGDRGWILSDLSKERMSRSTSGENNPNYGKKNSEETRKKISKGIKLFYQLHPERRLNSGQFKSEQLLGKKLSDEHKRKIGLSNIGKKRSPEFCTAIANANKRRVWTDEQRESVRQKMMGNKNYLKRKKFMVGMEEVTI